MLNFEFQMLEFQIELPGKKESMAKHFQVRFGDGYLICRWWR